MSFAGISRQIGGQVTGGTLGQASASGRGRVSPGPRPRASSMALPCRYATVAATVAHRLVPAWRRSAVALAALPARAKSSSRRRGTAALRTSVGMFQPLDGSKVATVSTATSP
jgi:hypothetical protein